MSHCDTICGQDCDDVFAYETQRFVRVKDRKLGILNITFMILIFGYVVGFNVVWEKGYRKVASVAGTARLYLYRPNTTLYIARRPEQLEYCLSGGATSGSYPMHVKPGYPAQQEDKAACRYLDANDAVYPSIEQEATFLATRIKNYHERIANLTSYEFDDDCNDLALPECGYKNSIQSTYYVGEPEFFTVWIDHTMSVPEYDLSASSSDLAGKLVDPDGTVLTPCEVYEDVLHDPSKCDKTRLFIGEPGQKDIMPMYSLMKAAGIPDLDARASDNDKIDLFNETIRYAGAVLVVSIEYTNEDSWTEADISYTISVQRIANAEYKGEELTPEPGVENVNRTIIDRHGLRVVVKQTGLVGRFDLGQLLVVLVTSLGLLAVASAIVNTLAFSVLPMRYVYKQYRTIESADFSKVEMLPESTIKKFSQEDLINPVPQVFAEFRREKDSESDQVVVDVRNPAAGSKVKEVAVDESPGRGGYGARAKAGGNATGKGFFSDTFGDGGEAAVAASFDDRNPRRDSSDSSLASSVNGLDYGDDPAFAGMEFGSRQEGRLAESPSSGQPARGGAAVGGQRFLRDGKSSGVERGGERSTTYGTYGMST